MSPSYKSTYEGISITVDESGVTWSGEDMAVEPDGTITRSERLIDAERIPDHFLKELLRRLLGMRN